MTERAARAASFLPARAARRCSASTYRHAGAGSAAGALGAQRRPRRPCCSPSRSNGATTPKTRPAFYWLAHGVMAATGPSLPVIYALRLAGIFAMAAGLYALARRVKPYPDPLLAACACFGVLAMLHFHWYLMFHLTNTALALALALAPALVLAVLNVRERASVGACALVGLAAGLGLLARYNFLLLVVALLVAGLTLPEWRRLLMRRRMLAAVAVAAALVGPHAAWVIGNAGTLAGQTGAQLVGEAPYAARVAASPRPRPASSPCPRVARPPLLPRHLPSADGRPTRRGPRCWPDRADAVASLGLVAAVYVLAGVGLRAAAPPVLPDVRAGLADRPARPGGAAAGGRRRRSRQGWRRCCVVAAVAFPLESAPRRRRLRGLRGVPAGRTRDVRGAAGGRVRARDHPGVGAAPGFADRGAARAVSRGAAGGLRLPALRTAAECRPWGLPDGLGRRPGVAGGLGAGSAPVPGLGLPLPPAATIGQVTGRLHLVGAPDAGDALRAGAGRARRLSLTARGGRIVLGIGRWTIFR